MIGIILPITTGSNCGKYGGRDTGGHNGLGGDQLVDGGSNYFLWWEFIYSKVRTCGDFLLSEKLTRNIIKYQPSGYGGTRSLPATHEKSKIAARGPKMADGSEKHFLALLANFAK